MYRAVEKVPSSSAIIFASSPNLESHRQERCPRTAQRDILSSSMRNAPARLVRVLGTVPALLLVHHPMTDALLAINRRTVIIGGGAALSTGVLKQPIPAHAATSAT